jgi:hypothetical protein
MSDIQVALDAIQQYRKPRKTLIDYYDGIHTLAYATEKFENAFGKTIQSMRDNLCATVVDAGVDRMEIIGFSGDDEAKKTADAAWQLWQNSQMELTSINTHTEALKSGVAFVIVWPDVKTGKAKFWLQNSLNCAVIKDAENDEPQFAAKLWTLADGKLRLNLFYADRVDMFVTQKKPDVGDLKEAAFVDFETPTQLNPYGSIPMFEFCVEPILANALPLQDALNKTLCDKLVAMEFAAFPQRWATGLEVPTDPVTGSKTPPFKAGIDRVWNSRDKDSKFGDFATANLEQFLKVADGYRIEIARVSGTPLHYFAIQSNAMSGEALKTLESRFTKRINRNNLAFGPVWSSAMRLALQIESKQVPDNLTTQWQSPEQRSEKEFLETLGLKRDILDIPVDTLREEANYSAEQITAFNADNELMPGVNDPNPDDAGTN